MGSIRNRVAEMVINVIDHECSHDGCAEQIPLSQLKQHEEDCPFKPIFCPAASCNKNVIMSRFVSHLQRKHLLSEGFGEFSGSFVVERGNNQDVKVSLDCEVKNGSKCWVFRWEERFFILSVKNNNGMKLNVFMTGWSRAILSTRQGMRNLYYLVADVMFGTLIMDTHPIGP